MPGLLPESERVSAEAPVLITRPLQKGLELAALLQPHGINSLVAPAFEIQLRDGDYLLEHKVLLQQTGVCMIFPSVNAVAGFFQALDNAVLAVPDQAQYIAVGPATAQALKGHGVKQVSCSQGANSEALLALPNLQTAVSSAGDVLIISAPGGRSLIEETLKQRGYRVCCIHVYQRQALPLAAKTSDYIRQLPAVNSVFTSAMALDVVFSDWPDWVADKITKGQALVISERLKVRAVAYGIQSVRVSSATDNHTMCAQIVQQMNASQA